MNVKRNKLELQNIALIKVAFISGIEDWDTETLMQFLSYANESLWQCREKYILCEGKGNSTVAWQAMA